MRVIGDWVIITLHLVFILYHPVGLLTGKIADAEGEVLIMQIILFTLKGFQKGVVKVVSVGTIGSKEEMISTVG